MFCRGWLARVSLYYICQGWTGHISVQLSDTNRIQLFLSLFFSINCDSDLVVALWNKPSQNTTEVSEFSWLEVWPVWWSDWRPQCDVRLRLYKSWIWINFCMHRRSQNIGSCPNAALVLLPVSLRGGRERAVLFSYTISKVWLAV